MITNEEIMSAAEAVLHAYLINLFQITDTIKTFTSSQDNMNFGSLLFISKLENSSLHLVNKEESDKKLINALRYDAQSFYVLSCIIEMVQNGLTCTERDVYYRNTLLFPNGQKDTHLSIIRLCRWMNRTHPLSFINSNDNNKEFQRYYSREGLRIGASGKSIIIGNLTFDIPADSSSSLPLYTNHSMDLNHNLENSRKEIQIKKKEREQKQNLNLNSSNSTKNSVKIDVSRYPSGVLVNTEIGLHGCNFRGAINNNNNNSPSALIIVEKESTLRTLVEAQGSLNSNVLLSKCIFLCSKGYPCKASRAFLKNIHRDLPQLPIFILVDGDPHGLRIALTFIGIFGNEKNILHNKTNQKQVINLDKLLPAKWVGVRPSALPHYMSGRAPLTLQDQQVLVRILQRIRETLSLLQPLLIKENNIKKDMEILYSCLTSMLREGEWMEKMSLKCSLQAWPDGPQNILAESF